MPPLPPEPHSVPPQSPTLAPNPLPLVPPSSTSGILETYLPLGIPKGVRFMLVLFGVSVIGALLSLVLPILLVISYAWFLAVVVGIMLSFYSLVKGIAAIFKLNFRLLLGALLLTLAVFAIGYGTCALNIGISGWTLE